MKISHAIRKKSLKMPPLKPINSGVEIASISSSHTNSRIYIALVRRTGFFLPLCNFRAETELRLIVSLPHNDFANDILFSPETTEAAFIFSQVDEQ